MFSSYRPLFIALLISLIPLAGTAESRTWTRDDGKTLNAEFVELKNTTVRLRLSNRKVIEIPLNRLSAADKAFIEGENAPEVHMARAWPEKVPGPRNFRLKKEVQRKKDADSSNHVYVTNNFRFTSQVELDEEACDAIGRLYEGALCAVREMPLPFPRADKKSRGKKDKLDALLTRDMAAYYAAGGPQGSAGVFRYSMSGSGKRKIREDDILNDMTIVPLPNLGISSEGKLVGKIPDTHVLVHEITHQLTCGVVSKAIWANEGMSEYVAYTPYDGTYFDFTGAFNKIANAGKMYFQSGSAPLPYDLETFFDFNQSQFYGQSPPAVGHPHRNYTLAAMMLGFYFHLDGERGVKAFRTYITHLQKNPEKAKRHLLAGRKSFKELQDDVAEAWSKHGLTIRFND